MNTRPLGIEPYARDTGGRRYEILGPAIGESSSFTLFFLAEVTNKASYDEAIEQAIRNKGGDNLIEVTSWRDSKNYIIGNVTTVHVNGKVIRYIH
jgi:hypothetical protein